MLKVSLSQESYTYPSIVPFAVTSLSAVTVCPNVWSPTDFGAEMLAPVSLSK